MDGADLDAKQCGETEGVGGAVEGGHVAGCNDDK